jgi:hypothetical protein
MPKALVLGCSFVAGSYYLEDGKTDVEWSDPSRSYVYWLDPGYEYDVYSISGGGYINYVTVMEKLKHKLHEYDYFLLQETFDPRFSMYNSLELEEFIVKNNDIEWRDRMRNINMMHNPAANRFFDMTTPSGIIRHAPINDDKLQYLRNIQKGRTARVLQEACCTRINEIAMEANLKMLVYNLRGEHNFKRDHFWGKVLDAKSLIDLGMFYNAKLQNFTDTWTGHFNETGNKKLGEYLCKIIDKELAQ